MYPVPAGVDGLLILLGWVHFGMAREWAAPVGCPYHHQKATLAGQPRKRNNVYFALHGSIFDNHRALLAHATNLSYILRVLLLSSSQCSFPNQGVQHRCEDCRIGIGTLLFREVLLGRLRAVRPGSRRRQVFLKKKFAELVQLLQKAIWQKNNA